MSLEEFIKYVEERYRKKMDVLVRQKENLEQESEDVLMRIRRLKPPIFNKKHPIFYALGSIGIVLSLVGLVFLLSKIFPFLANGITSIIVSIVSALSLLGGFSIYVQYKDEEGQDSERYLEYQEESHYLKNLLRILGKKHENCMWQIDALEYAVFMEENMQLARECYLYLIPSDAKKKKINIDERLLDDLVRTTNLPTIIYMYYRGELERYNRLSSYDRYKEAQSLDLKGKIELVKKEVEEETRRLKTAQQLDETTVSIELSDPQQVPYRRRRRAERYKNDNSQEMPIINESEKKDHRR